MSIRVKSAARLVMVFVSAMTTFTAPLAQAASEPALWEQAGEWQVYYDAGDTPEDRQCFAYLSGIMQKPSGQITAAVRLHRTIFTQKNAFSYSQTPTLKEVKYASLYIYNGDQTVEMIAPNIDFSTTEPMYLLTPDELTKFGTGNLFLIAEYLGTTVAGVAYPDGEYAVLAVRRCATEHANEDHGSGQPMVKNAVLVTPATITADDYPASALMANSSGRTEMALIISARGQVSHCEIKTSSGNPVLDETACTLLIRRTRFSPASDASGQPTEGTYTQGVTWAAP